MSELALRSKFTLWILDDQKTTQQQTTQSFEDKLKPVATFSTIQQFWQIFQYMNKPSKISEQADIYLFREDIKPLWEDPQNEKGGYYNIKIQKKKTDKIWQNAVFALISPTHEIATCINGVRVKIKQEFCNLQIWMNGRAPQNLPQVKQYLKESLQIADDRIFAFFYFSFMIKGIKGKEPPKQQIKEKDPNNSKDNWKNGTKQLRGKAGK